MDPQSVESLKRVYAQRFEDKDWAQDRDLLGHMVGMKLYEILQQSELTHQQKVDLEIHGDQTF